MSRNFCARFIALRLVLEAPIETVDFCAEYLFPGPEEDDVLRGLQVLKEELDLDLAAPFALTR